MGHITYSEIIAASPEQVWAIITDVTRLPDWSYQEGRFPYPVEGKYGSDQTEGVGTVWVGVAQDGQIARQKITDWQPPRRLSYELAEAENAPLKMTQQNVFELEPTEQGTRVTWQVDWQLTGGFSLSTLLIRLTGNSNFEEMMAGSLANLKRVVEAEAASGATADNGASSEPPA